MSRGVVGAEVLVIDQDPRVHDGITPLLSSVDLHVTCVADPEAAVARAQSQFFSVVLVDLDTPIPSGGIDIIRRLHAASPTTVVSSRTIVSRSRISSIGSSLVFARCA